MIPPRRRIALACVLAASLLPIVGCEAVSMVALMATGGDKVKPVFILPDRPTAIIVDDRQNRLGNPVLAGVVGSNVAYHLKKNGAITARIVPEKQVAALAAKLGEQYATTPIDQVGRLLGARQVIYLDIEQADLLAAPGAYRPTARVELKVIDAVSGTRLYPPPPPIDEPGVPSRGRSVGVQMPYQTVGTPSRGANAMLARELAERIGLEVARLFYEYRPDPAFE